ncbi:hypothetical protein [Methanothrix harundinacea]|uniref:DUF5320 domain-containing protein n=1 Tax=Methanothrix harundinacea (strain 6Ac) TaxID=1110509 RepID=G7WKV8_METH6|nr:hypothetical protein [Methanothrix harundinacea]AET64141.1 hypothetical protein Mhar_0768 [Methanothrix harundinacea 6Ac]
MRCGDDAGYRAPPLGRGAGRDEGCGCQGHGHDQAGHHGLGRSGEGGGCCCGGHPPVSREEMISTLEEYRGSLRRELERVEAKLRELTGD